MTDLSRADAMRSPPLGPGATGRKPRSLSRGRVSLYVMMVLAAVVVALPLYVMLVTAFKPLGEIRTGDLFSLPRTWTFDPWVAAWSSACSGLDCQGVGPGFWNSVRILIPSAFLTILLG